MIADEPRGALEFRSVTRDRTGAVGFEQSHAGGAESGHLIGAAHGTQLPGRQRRRHSLGAAVAARADPFDHRINSVAVALGISKPLEGNHGNPFADDDAVSAGIERRTFSAGRERLRLAEAQIAKRSLNRVEAAGDDQVAAPRHEFGHALVDGRQRRGACGIGGQVHAAEIQAVRDASGRDIRQNSGERVFGPFRQSFSNLRGQIAAEAGQFGAQSVLHSDIADTAAGADDDRGALPIERLDTVSGVDQRAVCDLQSHQLHGIDGLDRFRRHPVLRGIEGQVIEKAAPL